MIFVTVGHAVQGFDRLMRAVAEMKEGGILVGEVVVQHGRSRILPRGCRTVDFLSRDEFDGHIRHASIVITHGGAGSVGKCLRAGKKPVVVPRMRMFGEIVNDHQLELVRELDAQGRIYAAFGIADLPGIVERALSEGGAQPAPAGGSAVAAVVGEFIDRLAGAKAAAS